ncbi:MAG TPA: hypothetical protein VF920_15985 [Dongiaceae bacterium]
MAAALVFLRIGPAEAEKALPPTCRNTAFDLPITEEDHGTTPIASLHLGELGEQRVILDTGMGLNGILIGEPNFTPETKQWHDFKIVPVSETGQAIHLFAVSLPVSLADDIYTTTGSRYIINPMLLSQSGFTVMDLKHKRLIGFAKEQDLRRCYGHGTLSKILYNEATVGDVYIDARIDGKIDGRVAVDTGAYLTEFYHPGLRDDAAELTPEMAYYRLTGERFVPNLSHHHALQIGPTTHDLQTVAVPAGDNAMIRTYPAARIGYASLRQSILIFPPQGLGYWELIF